VSAVVIVEARLFNLAETLDGRELAFETGFTRLCPDLRALFEAAQEWRRWPLYARPALSQWSRGRITLLGDAAHPMLPFLAQGAAQAIEDADALGRACAPGVPLDAAFSAYEQARRTRATRVQTASRRQGVFLHASGLLATARNLAIVSLGGDRMLSRNAWLYR
jgi:salicylate hydroxylase